MLSPSLPFQIARRARTRSDLARGCEAARGNKKHIYIAFAARRMKNHIYIVIRERLQDLPYVREAAGKSIPFRNILHSQDPRP